jgi:hypothetical protein
MHIRRCPEDSGVSHGLLSSELPKGAAILVRQAHLANYTILTYIYFVQGRTMPCVTNVGICQYLLKCQSSRGFVKST